MNYITTYSDFMLNETLKTHDIDLSIEKISTQLNLQRYNFKIAKNENNTFKIELIDFNKIQNFSIYLSSLNSLITNRFGWFPSKMKIFNFSGQENEFSYDEDYLILQGKYFTNVTITYEPKYDIEINIPDKLYHLSIQEYEKNILKKGLFPKSKSKLSKHLDRIYLCKNITDCSDLIPRMKLYYSSKLLNNKINDKWVIYEIDTNGLNIRLYKDPNYDSGYYCINNISANSLKIIDREV